MNIKMMSFGIWDWGINEDEIVNNKRRRNYAKGILKTFTSIVATRVRVQTTMPPEGLHLRVNKNLIIIPLWLKVLKLSEIIKSVPNNIWPPLQKKSAKIFILINLWNLGEVRCRLWWPPKHPWFSVFWGAVPNKHDQHINVYGELLDNMSTIIQNIIIISIFMASF